jgi:hypothetical protein
MRIPVFLVLAVTGAVACSGGQAEVEDAVAPTDEPAPTSDTDAADTDTDDPGGACTWLATYDLTGSRFYIQATVDFTITVQEPYDEDLNTGPGRIVLRYPDGGGAPADGEVSLVEYQLTWDFVTGVDGLASVHTVIENQAGPEPAGLISGALSGDTLAWASPDLQTCQEGQISCTGGFCGTGGSPPEDEPQLVTGCEPWTILDFTLSPDRQTLDMPAAVVSSDADTETAMAFHGTRVELVEDCP